MCAVSAVFDYGRGMPENFWTTDSLDEFEKMLHQARVFDDRTNQPDCEDPSKAVWYEELKKKMMQH